MLFPKPVGLPPLVCYMLVSFASSTTDPNPDICQLADCSIRQLPSVQHPLCTSTFEMLTLRPATPLRRFPTSPKGRHLFDLFYDPGNCITMSLSFKSFPEINYLSVHVDITCQRESGVLFIYDSWDVLGSRCINHVSLDDGLARACNYHAHEQVRFTAIGNDTMLVEDLAPFLPPGMRMIFRKVANDSVRHQSPKCQCRILRRDLAKGVRCVQYHQRLLDEAEQLREIRRRIVQEFWTALGILVVSCSCTVVVKCWATRKISDSEYGGSHA